MFSVDLREPIVLSAKILKASMPKATPAVAALGELGPSGQFLIRHLIRSDSDIGSDLVQFIGRYCYCQVIPCKSRAEAYVLECELYHRLHPSDCLVHPGEPGGLNVLCPFCGYRMRPKSVA